jgi:hypothetical protein
MCGDASYHCSTLPTEDFFLQWYTSYNSSTEQLRKDIGYCFKPLIRYCVLDTAQSLAKQAIVNHNIAVKIVFQKSELYFV